MCTDFGIGPEFTLDILKKEFSLETGFDWSNGILNLLNRFVENFDLFESAALGLDLEIDQTVLEKMDQIKNQFGIESRSSLIYFLLLIFNRESVLNFEKEIQKSKVEEDLYFAELPTLNITITPGRV